MTLLLIQQFNSISAFNFTAFLVKRNGEIVQWYISCKWHWFPRHNCSVTCFWWVLGKSDWYGVTGHCDSQLFRWFLGGILSLSKSDRLCNQIMALFISGRMDSLSMISFCGETWFIVCMIAKMVRNEVKAFVEKN